MDFFAKWHVLPFDRAASERYANLRNRRIRIGSMDLRIAAIAIAHGGTLLSRNLRDFDQIPELRVEDWLADCPGAPG